jgi:hypothetical protein
VQQNEGRDNRAKKRERVREEEREERGKRRREKRPSKTGLAANIFFAIVSGKEIKNM